MPIKFACPHCKKGLSVKDHLAGKRAACPACKKALTIPKGSSTNHPALHDIPVRPVPAAPLPAKPPVSHHDAEAAAAEALADDPSEAQKQAGTVDFTCSFCDAELKLDAALAGKKTSCPECRRIIKVPELAQPEVADWRKAARTGPVGAKGPDVPEPEGAWGSARAQHVSRDALLDADVLPNRKIIPLTLRQKITRGVVYAIIGICAVSSIYLGYLMIFGSSEQRAVNGVIAYADSDGARERVGRGGTAVLNLAAGQYFGQQNNQSGTTAAKTQYEKALKQLTTGGTEAGGEDDRAGVFIDLAVAAAGLVGTQKQADEGVRLDEKESQKLLRAILDAMRNPEARLEALRLVTRRLAAEHQAPRALTLAAQVFSDPAEQGNAVATVGLELYAIGEKDLAVKAADQVMTPLNVSAGANAPAPASVIALATLLGRPVPKGDSDSTRTGQIEALALSGRAEEARKQAAADTGFDRVRADLAAAAGAAPDKQAVVDALSSIPIALKSPDRGRLPWMLTRLTRMGTEAGVDDDTLKPIADAISEPSLKARAHLLILRGRLARDAQQVPDDALTAMDPKTAAHYQARTDLARHNVRANSGYGASVQGWEEQYRPFGVIGTLLR
jgi:hypothetical protein